MLNSVHLSRARGCLLGQIAGDNLGALVEFRDAASIARRYSEGPRLLSDGGTWNILAGQPTDDSEMALALARAMVRDGGYDARAVAEAYVAWGDSHPFDMGGTTAAALDALRRGTMAGTASQANGALMRASPIGIRFAGDPVAAADAAEADAGLTHPHAVPVACNRAYVAAIATGIGGGDPEAMMIGAREALGGPDSAAVAERIDAALRGEFPGDYQRQMGWVLTALQNAFAHLVRGSGLAESVVATVRSGGDTDTNAAICGALLGATQGDEAIPLQWRNAIRGCRPGPGTLKPRPETYWPNDAEALAEALVRLALGEGAA